MSKAPPRNRPAATPRKTAVPPRKAVAARRGRPAVRRRLVRRQRRWLGWSIAAAIVVVAAVVAAVVVAAGGSRKSAANEALAVGAQAPDGTFTTASGQTETIASLRGQPALVWFVATWCSSCQAGTQAMASAIDKFDGEHVRVVELEQYDDLGQSGPSITQFGQVLAGASYSNPDWTWGTASEALTVTYNPKSYLDIYYLLDSSGKIVDIGSSPAATMNQLLAEVSALRSSSASAGTASASASESPAPAAVVKAATSVAASVAQAVGTPSVVSPPQLLQGQPLLTVAGKPAVIYVGAEYCPFCAAERWPAVVALSRFGTFSHLGETHSSDVDVYPGTQTFSFYGSTFTSHYIVFDPTETNTNRPSPDGGYAALQPLRGIARKAFLKYDSPPFVSQANAGAIPFYDFGNKVLVSGASYSPQVLQGLSASQIASALSKPSNPVAQAVVGTANYLTAAICRLTNNQPARVCQEPYVIAAASHLKLP
jgi:thiol-disulfide isomerase/thioredoxin